MNGPGKSARPDIYPYMVPMKRLLRYMPQIFFAGLALVTVLSLIPATSVPKTFQFWDKAQHTLSYLALSVTGCLAFRQRIAGVAVGLLAHGVVIEILQAALPAGRFGDVQDWLADAIGVLAGVLIFVCAASLSRGMSQRRD